ncbi:MAG: LLM class flavin-dependent oxidoreductase [Gammaproteobacteria bacterium]|nr:LLM class flavin-dependent oxidoreductase [Gammaproteobacteria bacterium]
MDVDIILEPDMTSGQLVELGQAAERLGIRALWMSNYFAHWDPFVALVPVALATRRLRLGALALSPFEMHPLKIANAVLSLNELSGGRAEVSIGAGEGNLDAMALGKPAKIVGAVREAVEIVIGAARGRLQQDGYRGEHFQVTYPCAYGWLKAPPPRVYLGAYRHQMMRAGARVADGVFIGCTPLEILEPAIAAIREGLARREQAGGDFVINSFWAWHLKQDRAAGYRESRRELAWRARKLDPELIGLCLDPQDVQRVRAHWQDFVNAWFDRSGDIRGVPDRITSTLCEAFTSTGGLEDIDREIERFRRFGRAGQTTIALRLHDDPMDALEIIGRHVVPALR